MGSLDHPLLSVFSSNMSHQLGHSKSNPVSSTISEFHELKDTLHSEFQLCSLFSLIIKRTKFLGERKDTREKKLQLR